MPGIGVGLSVSVARRPILGLPIGPVFDPADPRLRWAPPTLVNPVTYVVPTGFAQSPEYPADQDVIVQMPATARNLNSDMEVRGGRNVVLRGGVARSRVQLKGYAAEAYVEGLHINLAGAAAGKDALVLIGRDANARGTVQNYLATDLPVANGAQHPDAIQTQGPNGEVRVDRMTATTAYQGATNQPEFILGRLRYSRMNVRFTASAPGNQKGFWLRRMSGQTFAGDPVVPTELIECWCEANTGQPDRAAVFPGPGDATVGEPSAGAYAGFVEPDGSMAFPPASKIIGRVRRGVPPGGNFVTPAMVGLGYVPATDFQNA